MIVKAVVSARPFTEIELIEEGMKKLSGKKSACDEFFYPLVMV